MPPSRTDDYAQSPPSTDALSESQLIAQLARRYYLEDISKVELAKQFGISRFKIARLLAKGREEGIIRIEILEPTTDLPMFSSPLRDYLGLDLVRVIDSQGEATEIREQLGAMGASVIGELACPGDNVGFTWGRTMLSVASQLTDPPPFTAVQITGEIPSEAPTSPIERLRPRLEAVQGAAHAIKAPLFVGTTSERQTWMDDLTFVRGLFEHLDLAIVSVGSWDPPETQIRDEFPPAVTARIDASGAVGEIAGIWFNADGKVVAPEVTRLCVTLETHHLRHTPHVVAVAAGASKARAIIGAARSGFISGLVTDRDTAQRILET